LEVVFLDYREAFKLSWFEFCQTPWSVIEQDLEIWGIRAKIEEVKKQKNASKTRRNR